MSEWEELKFGDLYLEDVRNGIYKSTEYHGSGCRVVNMKELFAYEFIGKQEMKLINLDKKEKQKFLLKNGDLLFARRSLVESGSGKTSIVKDLEGEMTYESSIIRVRLNEKICDPLFYYYYLTSSSGRGKIISLSSGTNVKGIRGSDLKNVLVIIPPLPTQRRIASILSAYDDLIENNLKRIQLLEELAQRTYEEWFVKFRILGEQLEINPETGLPEGWDRKNCLETMDVLSGGTPKTNIEEYWNGPIGFFTPKDASSHSYTQTTQKNITELGLRKCNSKLYPKNTVFVTARGTVGKINMAIEAMAMNQSCYALRGKENISQFFLFNAMIATIEQFKSVANGGVFDTIVVDTFRYLKIIIPSQFLIEKFTQFVDPVYQKIERLIIQNRLLKESRDLLLPRLMSGSINVDAAEEEMKLVTEEPSGAIQNRRIKIK